MDLNAHDIIIRPLISEKANNGLAQQKYTFEVKKGSDKITIKRAFEKIFGIKVSKVNTINVRGVERRKGKTRGFTPAWKKACITARSGEKRIDFFDSMF